MIRLNCICPWRSLLALGMKTQYLLKEVRWYMPKMEENWEKKEFKDSWYGSYYYQVTSSDPWNYGLVDFDRNRMNEVAQVSINSQKQQLDFPLESGKCTG